MGNKMTVPGNRARKEGKPMAANDFSKVIIRDKEGNKYTLEFNARVVRNMERSGFKLDTDLPHTCIEELFIGAFQMHHKGMMRERIMSIWADQKDKNGLLAILTKLFMKPLEELMKEPEEDEENENPTWETV